MANTLYPAKKMYKKSINKFTVIRLQCSGLSVCCVSEICFVASIQAFWKQWLGKLYFASSFTSENIKDNLQTELSCWLKCVQV
jgi:hypothetical protein